MSEGIITRRGGTAAASGFPEFTYTGDYQFIDDGNKNWKIKFLTSGTLRFSRIDAVCDAFVVGGGGGGGSHAGGGGGGGYTRTTILTSLVKNVDYTITVGAGGMNGSGSSASSGKGTNGTASSIIDENGSSLISSNGGLGGNPFSGSPSSAGGNGGSGGGSGATNNTYTPYGGKDGSDGGKSNVRSGGIGQHTTTKEFGENDGTLYSTGGYGGISIHTKKAGDPNTGDGGDGGGNNGDSGMKGGSGIVILRNHREVA